MSLPQPPIDFDALSKSIYAQGAEEAMVSQIFERIAPRLRYAVEFGASDGLRNSNVAQLLLQHGWQGLFIESSDYRFSKLQSNWSGASNAKLVQASVQPDNVEKIFADANVPEQLDLISIDIDGNDYWVWRAIERYKPQVVIIEYNPYYAPPDLWVMKYNRDHAWDGSTYYGASLESLARLGKRKGYELVCCDKQGNNAFFVEASLFARFSISDNSAQALYRPAMYKIRFVGQNTFVTGHPYRYGPAENL